MNTIEQAREVSSNLKVKSSSLEKQAADAIDALIADLNEWRDEALSAQERFKAAEDKLVALRGQEPVEFRQFLSDVVTAAGLVECGKKSKGLAERLSEGAFRYMAAAPVQAGAQPAPKQEPVGVFRLYEGSYDHTAESYCHDDAVLLYAAPVEPQERKPLTDDQITEVWRELREQKGDWSDLDFARAIEAKIKEQT